MSFGSNWFIVLILFFLAMGNGGIFGNNNASLQGALTRADVNDVVQSQTIENAIASLHTSNDNGFAGLQIGMNNGFANVMSGINNIGYMMSQNCCDIKSTILADGQATRQLIQDNTIQDLRDKLNDKDQQILTATLEASQLAQTDALKAYIDAKVTTTTTTA